MKSKVQNSEWNAALYIRLSQDDKDNNISNSVVNQEKLLKDYVNKNCEEHFYVVESYIDDGYTGTNFERPAFKRMLQDMKDGIISCIIVKDLSRFGREHIDVDNYLERIFPLMGIRFVSVMQHIDSFKNPEKMNSIEIPFLNLINEEYARDISRKTKASLETKRREGKYVYSRAPYGYKKDPRDKHHLIIDDTKAENVCDVFRMFLQGESMQSIILSMRIKANTDEKWNKDKVKKILSNRIYTGDMVQGTTAKYNHKTKNRIALPEKDWIIVPNTHEVIVCKETFDAAQIQLKLQTSTKSESKKPSILARYLVCSDCGKKMVRTSTINNGQTYKRFICPTYKKLGKEACSSHIIDEEVLIEIVLTSIQNQIKCMVEVESLFKKATESTIILGKKRFCRDKIQHTEESLWKTKRLKQGLYEDYKAGILSIEEYEDMKVSYEKVISEKEKEIILQKDNLQKVQEESIYTNEYVENFKKHRNITMLTREVVLSLIKKIIVYQDKRIKILFKFEDEYKKIIPIIDEVKSKG